ncbi:MAG: potassium channel family protein [Rhodobacteraceae bacterium]|nr:potassium channel family protein [Paracoccaceae bacterium]
MLRKVIGGNRWAILLCLMLFSMLLEAFIAQTVGPTPFAELLALIFGISILLGLVFAVNHPGPVVAGSVAVLLLYGALGVLNVFTRAAWIDNMLLSLSSLVLLGGLVIVFMQLVEPMRSDREKLFSAVFGYFLVAWLWAYLYWRIETYMPGAMNFPDVGAGGGSAYLYYSLVTLTTLGYGDITPLLPIPRILAALEAALGTLYVAVLIGQIVGQARR